MVDHPFPVPPALRFVNPGRTLVLALAAGALTGGCGRGAGVHHQDAIVLHAHPGDCRQCHGVVPPAGPPPPGRCAAPGCHRTLEPPPRLVHGPVAAGGCRTCHLPHSSVAPHLLAAPAPRLCGGCHDQLYTCLAAGKPEADCVSCHQPHGGSPGFLRPAAERPAAAD